MAGLLSSRLAIFLQIYTIFISLELDSVQAVLALVSLLVAVSQSTSLAGGYTRMLFRAATKRRDSLCEIGLILLIHQLSFYYWNLLLVGFFCLEIYKQLFLTNCKLSYGCRICGTWERFIDNCHNVERVWGVVSFWNFSYKWCDVILYITNYRKPKILPVMKENTFNLKVKNCRVHQPTNPSWYSIDFSCFFNIQFIQNAKLLFTVNVISIYRFYIYMRKFYPYWMW